MLAWQQTKTVGKGHGSLEFITSFVKGLQLVDEYTLPLGTAQRQKKTLGCWCVEDAWVCFALFLNNG
jgi:hypothetical protein